MGLLKTIYTRNLNPFLALSLGLTVVTRMVTFVAMPIPINSPDSPTYYSGNFLDFSLVSLTGSASRGWVVPLVYAFMPSSIILGLFQLLFSGLAWSLLLLTIPKIKVLSIKSKNILLLLVSLLGSSPQVIQHDMSVLSTSITNSVFILLFTILLRARYTIGNLKLNLFTGIGCSGLLMVQKTSFFPIAIGFLLLLTIVSFKNATIKIKSIGLIAISFLTIYSVVIGSNINSNWQVSYSGQTLLWQLGGQSPAASEFASFLKGQNAPNCITSEAPYTDLNLSIGKILNDCPESFSYLENGIQRDFVLFILSTPTNAIKLATFGIGAAVTSSATNYGAAVSIIPNFVSDIFFGATAPQLRGSVVGDQVAGLNLFKTSGTFWLSAPLLGWIVLSVICFFARRDSRKDDALLYSVLVLCLLQSIFVVILLPSEWVRQTLPFMLGILISSFVLSVKNLYPIFERATTNDK